LSHPYKSNKQQNNLHPLTPVITLALILKLLVLVLPMAVAISALQIWRCCLAICLSVLATGKVSPEHCYNKLVAYDVNLMT